jgi:hypothetical protein
MLRDVSDESGLSTFRVEETTLKTEAARSSAIFVPIYHNMLLTKIELCLLFLNIF